MPEPMSDARLPGCTFCGIVAGTKAAVIVHAWPDAIAFRDKNELVPGGHILVVPRAHVADATANPGVTGQVMARAASIAALIRAGELIIDNLDGATPESRAEADQALEEAKFAGIVLNETLLEERKGHA